MIRKAAPVSPKAIASVLGALPPHSLEAEAGVLGSILMDPTIVGDVLELIPIADWFYDQKNAVVYQAMLDLHERGTPLDAVALKDRLSNAGTLDQIGGVDYLVWLLDGVASVANARNHAESVADYARRRELISAAYRAIEQAQTSTDAVAEILDAHEGAVYEIADRSERSGPETASRILQDAYDDVTSGEGSFGVATGFIELDRVTNGLHAGELIIIAARPSMGKTALALQVALNAAAQGRIPTGIFSLEMSKRELGLRLLSMRSQIPCAAIRSHDLTPDQCAKLALAVGSMAEAPLIIDDSAAISLMQLRARARRMASRHGVRLLVVDYLQLMRAPGTENRLQEVSALSRGLKQIAKELNLPIICLSQLNRASEQRENKRPRMCDLRESGTIEQDADVVMMLHREDYYRKGEPGYNETHEAEVIIVKQRNGPTGTVRLGWSGTTMSFSENAPGNSYPGGG